MITLIVYDDGWKELDRVTVKEDGTYDLATRDWTNSPAATTTGVLPADVFRSVRDQVKAGLFERKQGVAVYSWGIDDSRVVPPASVLTVLRSVGLKTHRLVDGRQTQGPLQK